MVDLASISAALSSVKTATEIARFIKDSDASLANAEAKLKIADLIGSLADIKLDLSEVQDKLREKDQLINALKEQLEKQKDIKYDGSLYWVKGDTVPFCSACYESNRQLIHLTHFVGNSEYMPYHHCRVCKQNYSDTEHA